MRNNLFLCHLFTHTKINNKQFTFDQESNLSDCATQHKNLKVFEVVNTCQCLYLKLKLLTLSRILVKLPKIKNYNRGWIFRHLCLYGNDEYKQKRALTRQQVPTSVLELVLNHHLFCSMAIIRLNCMLKICHHQLLWETFVCWCWIMTHTTYRTPAIKINTDFRLWL